MDTNSDWLKTLIYFGEKGYYENGLTIPFLCGTNTILSKAASALTIDEIILQICDNSFRHDISILKCGGIGEFVFGILDSHSKETYQNYLNKGKEIYLKIDNIYITDGSIQNISSKLELIELLKEKYSDILSNKHFSKNGGKWSNYIPIDISRLNEIE